MARLALRAAAVPLLLCVGGMPAAAQETPAPVQQSAKAPRGNGGLFGGTDGSAQVRSSAIDLTVAVSGAYDDDLSEGQQLSALQEPRGGEFTDLSGALSLSRRGHHSRMTARGMSSLRHYPTLSRFVGSSYSGGADFALDMTRKTAMQASVDAAYVSEFAFDTVSRQSGLGQAAFSSAGLDIAALDGARLSYGAAVGITRKVGMRSALTVNAGGRRSQRRIIDEQADEMSAGAHLARSVGRDASIGLGYTLRSSAQSLGGDSRPAWTNDVQVDVERRWRHSAGRRTVLSFSAGESLLQPGAPAAGQRAVSNQARLVGAAALNHDMGRSWNVGTSYRRGAGSADGLLSDSAAVDLRGLLSPRAELTLAAGYSQTDFGVSGRPTRYITKFGSGRLQVALTRALAVYGQYVLYAYDLENGAPVSSALGLRQDRRGVRAGLTLWIPVEERR